MIKNVSDLNERKEAAVNAVTKGENGKELTRVLVGMATCGMAAGATPVYNAIEKTVAELSLENISIIKTGCIGMCQHEPIVEILAPGKEKVTYVQVNAEKAEEIVKEHLAKGKIVAEYNVGSLI